MKKYFIYLIVFTITFIFSFILLFPYNTFSRYLLNRYIFSKYRNIISYRTIESNFSKTEIDDIQVYLHNKLFNIKSIIINHNPILLLKKEIAICSNPLKLKFFLKKNDHQILYKGNWNLASLAYYTKYKVINGEIKVNGKLDWLSKTGIVHLHSNKLILKDDLLNLNLKNIVGVILIDRNRITIKKFSAKGTPELNITGSIILNPKYIAMSPINIRLKINSFHITKYITISGTLFNPQIIY